MNTYQTLSISTDYDVPAGQPGRYVITEERQEGYVILARCKRLGDAKRLVAQMESR